MHILKGKLEKIGEKGWKKCFSMEDLSQWIYMIKEKPER